MQALKKDILHFKLHIVTSPESQEVTVSFIIMNYLNKFNTHPSWCGLGLYFLHWTFLSLLGSTVPQTLRSDFPLQ